MHCNHERLLESIESTDSAGENGARVLGLGASECVLRLSGHSTGALHIFMLCGFSCNVGN